MVVIMAALVFYGGAGVNIASFCCDDCRKAGMEVLKGDMCCEIHGHSHDDMPAIESAEGRFGHSDEMCCNMMRKNFDWNYDNDVEIDLQPLALDLLAFGTPDASLIPIPFVNEVTFVMPTGPPLCPRTYLSLLTTLLI